MSTPMQNTDELRQEIARLNQSRIIRCNRTWGQVIGFSFLRGLFSGLGFMLGAVIILWCALWFLSQIHFLPILGEWIEQILSKIPSLRPQG